MIFKTFTVKSQATIFRPTYLSGTKVDKIFDTTSFFPLNLLFHDRHTHLANGKWLLLKLVELMDDELNLVVSHCGMAGDAKLLIGDES